MSIALMVSQAEGGETIDYAPIATQSTFRDLWIPACNELGLELIPLFESGMLITDEVIDEVLNEFERLEAFVHRRFDIANSENLIERIHTLQSKLIANKDKANVSIWIG